MKLKNLSLIATITLLFGCNFDGESTSESVSPTLVVQPVSPPPIIKPVSPPPIIQPVVTPTVVNSQYYTVNRILDVPLKKLNASPINTLMVNVGEIDKIKNVHIADLNNIQILDGKIINKTPYKINSLYVVLDKRLLDITFSKSIPPYSQGGISKTIKPTRIVNLTTISNGTINYKANIKMSGKNNKSRHANNEERITAERMQMYDRFMMNKPSSLEEIKQHIVNTCNKNNYCKNYKDTPENYAIDSYFAKSKSGIQTRFWINPGIWGMATVSKLEMLSSRSKHYGQLWMNPRLMKNVHHKSTRKAKDAWQALAHELYHNYGFSHDSGWPSHYGIDDMFGKKAVEDYLINNSNRHITSNVIFDTPERINKNKFKFKLHTNKIDVGTLNVRLLSTKKMAVNLTQNGSNELIIEFHKMPISDIYVSFYSENSQQMATIPLAFIKSIKDNNGLRSFNANIHKFLLTYNIVYVATKNGAWNRSFILPSKGVAKGKKVNFSSSAKSTSKIYHDGGHSVLSYGDKIYYTFDGTVWQKTIIN